MAEQDAPQEPVSAPRQQLPWQNLSDVNILKHRSLFEVFLLQREGLDGKLWVSLVNFSS